MAVSFTQLHFRAFRMLLVEQKKQVWQSRTMEGWERWLGNAKLRRFGIVIESTGFRERDVPIESFLFGSHLTDQLIVSFNLPASERQEMDGGTHRKEQTSSAKKTASLVEYGFPE